MSCIVPNCQAKLSNLKLSLHLFPDPQRDPKRHLSWIRAINFDRILKYDPMVVFKRFRVCRNHFKKDCFNGECKKLLTSAIPTINIPDVSKPKSKLFIEYEQKILTMLKRNSINVEAESLQLINLEEATRQESITVLKHLEDELETDENEEGILLMEVEDCDDQSTKYTIVMPPLESLTKQPKVLNFNNRKLHIPKPIENRKESEVKVPLNLTTLKQHQIEFNNNPKNLLVQNICSKISLYDAFHLPDQADFTHEIDTKMPEMIDKIHWSFTPFVMLKIPLIESQELQHFEFSQAYFMFYEKLEKCYSFLNDFVDRLQSTEDINEDILKSLLKDPLKEGGRWNTFINIINKYGLIPQEVFPGNITKERINQLNQILKSKLREFSSNLLHLVEKKADTKTTIESQIKEIFEILQICFGSPPDKFLWKHKSTNNKITTSLTPKEFYKQFIENYTNFDDKLCLINDPRYAFKHQNYTADCFDDVIGGTKVLYINQSPEVLLCSVVKSIIDESVVLAICSVNAINSFKLRNFHLLCDIKINTSLQKTDRLKLNDFDKKRAMIISAIAVDSKGKLEHFRLEDHHNGKKEFISVPKEYFHEIVMEIIVDKKYLSIESFQDGNPVILNPQDPILSPFA